MPTYASGCSMLLRFGWDVPVILRNSEEIESSVRISKKQMRQVKNPFGLEIPHPAAVSITSQCIFFVRFY